MALLDGAPEYHAGLESSFPMFHALLLATLVATPQDPLHAPTMLERIDSLIVKSNAYKGFVARYRGFDADEHDLTVRIAYRSPSELVIDVEGKNSRLMYRVHGNAYDKLEITGDSEAAKGSIEDWNPVGRYARCARGLFEREFPGSLRADDLPDLGTLIIQMEPSPSGLGWRLNFAGGTADRPRLGWLREAHGHPELLSPGRDGAKEIVFSPSEGLRMVISTESGFVIRCEKQTTEGPRIGMDLVSVETASWPADSEFELPAVGAGVRDCSDDLRVETDDRGFLVSRVNLFSTLARALDDGRLKWTDDTPARIELVLLGLHKMHSASFMAGAVAIVHGLVDKKATSFRDWLKQVDLTDGKTLAQATEWVRTARELMEKQLQTLRDEYAADEPVAGSCMQPLSGACKVRASLYEELATIEKRIQPKLYTEGVIEPALAEFDEKVGKQLEAK